MPLTPLERMQHQASCRPAGEQQQQPEEGQQFLMLMFILRCLLVLDHLNTCTSWLDTCWEMNYVRLTVGLCFQSQKVERQAPPQCPVSLECITVTSVMKTWPSPPLRSSNTKGSTCFLLSDWLQHLQSNSYSQCVCSVEDRFDFMEWGCSTFVIVRLPIWIWGILLNCY